jgi:hypothetical protein
VEQKLYVSRTAEQETGKPNQAKKMGPSKIEWPIVEVTREPHKNLRLSVRIVPTLGLAFRPRGAVLLLRSIVLLLRSTLMLRNGSIGSIHVSVIGSCGVVRPI